MYYLFILAFFCNLYSATSDAPNIPHILLLQYPTSTRFDFLINQAGNSRPDGGQFCQLPHKENNGEDLFPIEYDISFSSDETNSYCFYHNLDRKLFDRSQRDFTFATTEGYYKHLFSYLNENRDNKKITSKIRCILIHNPTFRRLPNPYDNSPNALQLIFIPNNVKLTFPDSESEPIHEDILQLEATPIVITYDTYDEKLKNDVLKFYEAICKEKNPVLLLDSSIPDFQIIINNIISTYYKKDLFQALIDQKNPVVISSTTPAEPIVINSTIFPTTRNKIQIARWFASKTSRQRFMIRRVRDMGLLTLLFGIIFSCYKTIKIA